MDDYEIEIDDLILLEEPGEFKKWLYSLHQEIQITELEPLRFFYTSIEWLDHVKIIDEFNTLFEL